MLYLYGVRSSSLAHTQSFCSMISDRQCVKCGNVKKTLPVVDEQIGAHVNGTRSHTYEMANLMCINRSDCVGISFHSFGFCTTAVHSHIYVYMAIVFAVN